MKREKLKLFIGIFLSSPVILTLLFVFIFSIEGLFLNEKQLYFQTDVEDTFGGGLFIGLINALIFIFLDWRKKSESIVYLILSNFAVVELIILFCFIIEFLPMSHIKYYGASSSAFYLFVERSGIHFVKASSFLAVFSVITGIFNKKLASRIKNRNVMP